MIAVYLLAFCRVTTGLVFAFSSFSKARNLSAFKQAIPGFQLLPPQIHSLAAILFLCGEGLVVLLLAVGGSLLFYGFTLALCLLLVFCLALATVLFRKLHVSCNCFGSSQQTITSADIWRNVGFMACAACGCSILTWMRDTKLSLEGIEWLLISLGALAFVLIWIQLGEVAQLFRHS